MIKSIAAGAVVSFLLAGPALGQFDGSYASLATRPKAERTIYFAGALDAYMMTFLATGNTERMNFFRKCLEKAGVDAKEVDDGVAAVGARMPDVMDSPPAAGMIVYLGELCRPPQ
jgi:hypothetical protein